MGEINLFCKSRTGDITGKLLENETVSFKSIVMENYRFTVLEVLEQTYFLELTKEGYYVST